jgi:NAD(P)-dependent dehydrogenase (short-subunit alcohol dehydrogenase family)
VEELEDKVAVITGAASGIGRSLALAFAREGTRVSLADIEADPLEETAEMVRAIGVDVFTHVTDVSDALQVESLAAETVDNLGSLHIACNNAGVSGGGLSWEVPLETWDWILGVNLYGVIHGIRSFVPRIIEAGEGHVVNTASMAGLTSPPFMSPYNVSKHAVVTLSEALSVELSMTNPEIGVTALCPGWVRTRIHEADRNKPGNVVGLQEDAVALRESMVKPLIEGGKDPDEVAAMVVEAVKTRRSWVLTHEDWQGSITERAERIVSGNNPSPAFLPLE